jgi:hypothetical protein
MAVDFGNWVDLSMFFLSLFFENIFPEPTLGMFLVKSQISHIMDGCVNLAVFFLLDEISAQVGLYISGGMFLLTLVILFCVDRSQAFDVSADLTCRIISIVEGINKSIPINF